MSPSFTFTMKISVKLVVQMAGLQMGLRDQTYAKNVTTTVRLALERDHSAERVTLASSSILLI